MAIDRKSLGKKSREAGKRFELKVRRDLEGDGWVVEKWSNTIDLENNCFKNAPPKFLGRGKPMMLGSGFPDFIAFKKAPSGNYVIMFVECKKGKYLDKKEREKMNWLIKHGFEPWVAWDNDGHISYKRIDE